MRVVLLGSTGYHPNEIRHTACLMLPELGIVLDAGTGMFRVRDRLVTEELHIFLTHAHLDHSFGLTFLFDVLHERPTKRVVVYGEAAKLAAIQEHLLHELLFPVKLPCEYRPFDGDVELPGGGRLSHFPLGHPGATVGFRLEWPGHSMAYVTDTTADPAADYVGRLRGVDLLIHECNFDDSLREHAILTGHSTTTSVAQVARAAGVRRLVLTHLNAISNEVDPVGLDVARAIFPETWLATDGLELEF
ncbi:MAG TPA: MBL fold metallo-hydrolase [Pirellulales bacterium]|jgi:ribonuclease BN (tRNA processing enzyme)|nr:MBL fold metallo-hydrolase [Pirellulales bacterium]HEV3024164.1 MBL fold metallo-hydrolase [Pirellulales bacterium]